MSNWRTPVGKVQRETLRSPQQPSPSSEPPASSSPMALMIGAGVAAVLIVVAVVSILIFREPAAPTALNETGTIGMPNGAAQPAGLPTAAPTSVPTPAPTPTPGEECTSGQPQLALIADLVGKGDWVQAATIANVTLDVADLCDRDRRPLTQQAVSSVWKALLQEKFRPLDVDGQQSMVDRYLALQARARDAGVEFPSSLQSAEEAYSRSQFLLAKVAVEQALAAAEYQPELDRDITHMYVSTLYGLCAWYTTAEQGSELYQHGLAYCVASNELAEQFCTGQGEAATTLNSQLTSDRQRWPEAARTPLQSYARAGCA